METTNLGEADGLPVIEWSQVETQVADLLTHDDPRSPNRSTFWLTTLNADGSPHVTSVGEEWMASAARRLGNRHHRTVQRADARTTAVVRLRSQAAYRDRSRYRR